MPFTQFRYYCKIFFQPSASAHHLDKKTTACSCGYSSTLTEALKQRIQVLEVENCRLMTNQGQLVAETNRRVEMHISEVRTLKEELKKLRESNKELRDLCCFLDDDRQKTRRLSREWQKFGRYTSEVMKQEVKAYQAKLRELENRQHLLIGENDELKRLCLYLDEQRQSILLSKVTKGDQTIISRDKSSIKNSNDSNGCDSSGCGILVVYSIFYLFIYLFFVGTVLSSGTTYCSSCSDGSVDTTVFVSGEDFDDGDTHLEVRTLGPIDEKAEDSSAEKAHLKSTNTELTESNCQNPVNSTDVQMPPTIAPVSVSVVCFFLQCLSASECLK
ncbi:unnamed protein product [Enterobius vermicularis]|uniref:Coiled-coil domain-containing protein 85A n=1 Tax=Enterobius vermicularis TaxID=51028 RepID=A0A0N4VHM4_ENTVE|nr:unnamed protein product [Enterobius vermicularis]